MKYSGLGVSTLQAVVESGPTPLFATISGAHLYGFESPDSDIDLRGAFVLPVREVLRLVPPVATLTIDRIVEGREVDWVAHDVHKFAKLMTRRNGYVLEQVFSPHVIVSGPWLDELREIGRGCIVRHLHHHYRGFFFNQKKELDRPGATVKDLLYAYRVLMTGIHVLRTGEIEAHLPTLNATFGLGFLDELIARKRAGAEHTALGTAERASHEASLEKLLAELQTAFEESNLPDEVTTFAALDDYVVRARLALGS